MGEKRTLATEVTNQLLDALDLNGEINQINIEKSVNQENGIDDSWVEKAIETVSGLNSLEVKDISPTRDDLLEMEPEEMRIFLSNHPEISNMFFPVGSFETPNDFLQERGVEQ